MNDFSGRDPVTGPTPLSGQVAIVTGGSRGLGRLLAQTLAEAGAVVAVTGRSEERLAETVASIEEAGGSAIALPGDASDVEAVAAVVDEVERRFGRVDLLVNNAGLGGPIGAAWEVDEAAWWEAFTVNVRGLFAFTRAVLPGMIARRSGRVLNMASNAGAFRWPSVSAYAVSKAAVIKFTENLAVEVRDHGVKVFAVHPGLLPIGMTETLFEAAESPTPLHPAAERIHWWTRQQLATGRGALPEDAAELVLRLARGEADALSGCYVTVHDDVAEMVGHAEDGRIDDLYTLQIRRPEPPAGRRGAAVPGEGGSPATGRTRPMQRSGSRSVGRRSA
jgi:NAD(P)-dependent dehydrogenase (short-subunit alcohol dehydrogenase family)